GRLNVLHCRNKSCRTERVWPVVVFLRRQQFVSSRTRQIVKRRRRFRRQHRRNRVIRKFRQFDGHQCHPHPPQFGQRCIQVFSIILLPRLHRLPPLFLLLAFLLFFLSFRRLFLCSFRLFRSWLKCRFNIPHTHLLPI